ncbi:unnamed protein product [Coffea canephora]|uniref:Uncharacterized protein n=1 Tax=Coffea canephora TaxID=49390 RepID=A0A068V4D5_COFCA|nr:unnamed protein product [Coffea canephora]
MAVANEKPPMSEVKVWSFCRLPFWQSTNNAAAGGGGGSGSSSLQQNHLAAADHQPSIKVASVAKSFLPTRRRLGLDPPNKLYFPCMWANLFSLMHASFSLMLYIYVREAEVVHFDACLHCE